MVKTERGRRERVATEVPGLDAVLEGGVFRGGIYAVRGAPGSGKTILGNQICFSNARRGGTSTYVTLLAESHARMMVHLESLDFFDPELVDGRVTYLSGYNALVSQGLRGVLNLVRSAVMPSRTRRGAPKTGSVVVVIDGFLTAAESAASVTDLKKFIHELQLSADLVGATVYLLAGPAASEASPEYTMVDGIIELQETLVGVRAHRELRVRKLRGGAHLRGAHMFSISNAGIRVYPRVEARHADPSADDGCVGKPRLKTGVEQLDEMLRGGLGCGSTTLVMGPSGSGKTTLGLHFLAATPAGENAVHFGFYETPARLLEKARALGLRLGARAKNGEWEVIWQPSTEQHIDALAEKLLAAVERTKATRLVIDGLDGFQRATVHPQRVHRAFTAIGNQLRVRGVSTMYTFELPKFISPDLDAPLSGVSALAENLILLRNAQARTSMHRLVSILKVRDSDYDASIREFRISNRGIRVEANSRSAEAILGGTARPS